MTTAISLYIEDMKAERRINTMRTEQSYWDCLRLHAEDVGNRDPRATNRNDVKRTLRRWENGNTRRTRHAYITSFYDWCMQEDSCRRPDNPARQVRRTKAEETEVYHLTANECSILRAHAKTALEIRLIDVGLFAGLRVQELRGLKGIHFAREGWVHVSKDIGKGRKERWVPVLDDLIPVVDEITATVALDEHVFPGQHFGIYDKDRHYERKVFADRPMGANTMWKYVRKIAVRGGIHGDVGPHTLRHAFCDLVTRGASIQVAQSLMGHSDIGTTEGYTTAPTLDELRAAVQGLTFGGPSPLRGGPKNLGVETAGIEPASPAPSDGAVRGIGQE